MASKSTAATGRGATAPTATDATAGTRTSPAKKELARAFSRLRLLLLSFSFMYCLNKAYRIRMFSVQLYGYIIHEFDPWFNYRAAEYMSAHGWSAFFSWFDYMSWYPLGRPVGPPRRCHPPRIGGCRGADVPQQCVRADPGVVWCHRYCSRSANDL
uniref:dolichyl-diphosphooligosaccharide--protein glycotransferase n=1 Tax=Leishmania guyanensis TaxID=5670 RepID=A0A1E1IZ66_LEIGU